MPIKTKPKAKPESRSSFRKKIKTRLNFDNLDDSSSPVIDEYQNQLLFDEKESQDNFETVKDKIDNTSLAVGMEPRGGKVLKPMTSRNLQL